jgi:hypothetical protein
MTETATTLTVHIWDGREYSREIVHEYLGTIPVPNVGEELLFNVAESGDIVEFQRFTIERRVFGYVAGFVRTLDETRGDHVAGVTVDLFIRPRRLTEYKNGNDEPGSADVSGTVTRVPIPRARDLR